MSDEVPKPAGDSMTAAEKAEARRRKILSGADQRMAKLMSMNAGTNPCMQPRFAEI